MLREGKQLTAVVQAEIVRAQVAAMGDVAVRVRAEMREPKSFATLAATGCIAP